MIVDHVKEIKGNSQDEEEKLSSNRSRNSFSANDENKTNFTADEQQDVCKTTRYGSFSFSSSPQYNSNMEISNDSEHKIYMACEDMNKNENNFQSGKVYFDNLALSIEENNPDIKLYSAEAKNQKCSKRHSTESVQSYISIKRNIFDEEEISKKYGKPHKLRESIVKQIAKCCRCSPISCIYSLFPILVWLPKYPFKQYILSDIIAGFTLAVLQIPQGMAYGLLASVDAINGLYVSFFPVLIYCLMGTSRHISIGTFAIISIMLSNTVAKFETVDSRQTANLIRNISNNSISAEAADNSYTQHSNEWPPTKLEVVVAASVVVGLWQIAMGAFRLGILNVILSDQLISGFTTGAAIHVSMSQLKDLFGIKIARYNGPLQLIKTLINIIKNLKYTNLTTLLISAISLFSLAVVKDHVNDRFRSKLIMPIPIDLVVIIVATVASYYGNFNNNYNVEVMNKIPTGLPAPEIPRVDLFPNLIADSFSIAIVVFAITLSMAKLFAKKHHYEINPNQELIALGSANLFSSFFLCYPCATSLSRSLVQERAGGKTQLANFISCLLLLIVLLFLAPYFSALPKCILSAVILVALKGMFLQMKDFWTTWKVSRLDAIVWMVALLSVILTSIDFGLLIGVCFSIFVVLIRIVIPDLVVLGNLPKTEIYLDIERYECKEIENIRIYHYGGVLCFLNREFFKASLMRNLFEKSKKNMTTVSNNKTSDDQAITYVILDCSSISFLDLSAINTLIEIKNELTESRINLIFSSCPAFMYQMLEKANFFEVNNIPHFFPSVHDAVLYCQNNFSIRL
ncbi:prestin-like isoform X2 [Centruroides vittatus]|uniref:prestin-like isoform X2 n=1 Tax=Centruroides vittatus TaxID=120091 RepID=UPI003510C3F4